jgi:hypothetical protein
MKKLLLSLFILISTAACGQTPAGYTYVAARYKWIAGMVDSGFHVPTYIGTPVGRRTGVTNRSGAVAMDTTNHLFYIYTGGSWRRMALYSEVGSSGMDTLYRKPGQDSLFYTIGGGAERSVKDSTGGGIPSGNYGNLQINRNGVFATPGGDTLNYNTTNGLTVLNKMGVGTSTVQTGVALDVRSATANYGAQIYNESATTGQSVPLFLSGKNAGGNTSTASIEMLTKGTGNNLIFRTSSSNNGLASFGTEGMRINEYGEVSAGGAITIDSALTVKLGISATGGLRIDKKFNTPNWDLIPLDTPNYKLDVVHNTTGLHKKMHWPVSATVYANNGLTKVVDTVKLGGTLTANTTINADNFYLSLTGTRTSFPGRVLIVNNTNDGGAIFGETGAGNAIFGTANSGNGILGTSTSGIGGSFSTNSYIGIYGAAVSGKAIVGNAEHSTTNTVRTVYELSRTTSGTPSSGIGGSFDFKTSSLAGETLSNQLISKLTTVTGGSETSQFIVAGVNNAVTGDIISFEGNKRTMLYGRLEQQQGADVASVAGAIAVGLDGNIFELTGTNAVTLISNLNWVNGSVIHLLFTSTATLTDGTANSGTDIGMELAGGANFTGSADDVVTLVLSEIGGTQRWREVSRSVN